MLAHVDEGAIPLAVVKGNGYGHGLTIAAQVFADVGFKELGVADLNEAITLRQARRRRLRGGLFEGRMRAVNRHSLLALRRRRSGATAHECGRSAHTAGPSVKITSSTRPRMTRPHACMHHRLPCCAACTRTAQRWATPLHRHHLRLPHGVETPGVRMEAASSGQRPCGRPTRASHAPAPLSLTLL